MHRQPILQLLAQYRAALTESDSQITVVDRLRRFVEEHEDCFERSLAIGHVTGSAFIIDGVAQSCLLTHHRKLDIWVQLGGHADGDSAIGKVAMREAREESGLASLRYAQRGIFDVDIHRIPANKHEVEHYHYDVRFLLVADRDEPLQVSDESHELRWVALDRLADFTDEESMHRMARAVAEAKASL